MVSIGFHWYHRISSAIICCLPIPASQSSSSCVPPVLNSLRLWHCGSRDRGPPLSRTLRAISGNHYASWIRLGHVGVSHLLSIHERAYLYTYAHLYTHINMYVCMSVCLSACLYGCMHVWMYAYMHVCMNACNYACMHVCMYVRTYVGMCVCMYVCMLASP